MSGSVPDVQDVACPALLPDAQIVRHHVAVEWAQAATIVSALAAFTGLQALWISRALDRVHATLDRLDAKFDHVEGVVLRDHGERIARLEAAQSP